MKKNNWNSPSKYLGRAGKNNEFLLRGAVQCLGGIVSNDVEESVYLNTAIDSEGKRLSGSSKYILHFPSGQLPKVKAFWSLTLYGMDFCLVDNPANKYSVGDRTPGLTKDADRGLTIYIQKDSPGMDKNANWLPTNDREFYVVLRCYLPDEEIYETSLVSAGNRIKKLKIFPKELI